MKICFVAPRLHTNQIPIIRVLQAKGHDVTFVAQYIGGSEDHSLVKPVQIGYTWWFNRKLSRYRTNNPNPDDPFKFERQKGAPSYWKLLRYFSEQRPDVLIVRDHHLKISRRVFVISRLLGLKTILYLQLPKSELEQGLRESSILRRLFNQLFLPRVIMTPLQGTDSAQSASRHHVYHIPFIATVNPGVANRTFFANNRINLLDIGKFVPRKRHLLLLKAINTLKDRYDLHLTIVGEVSTDNHRQELSKTQQYIQDNGLDDIVTIKTNLPYADVQSEYIKHDLFVMPAINEPMAVSPIEAMASQLPVICSDTSGTREYLRNGLNGYIVQSDDEADLTQKVEQVIQDRNRLLEMATQSLELIKSEYSEAQYYAKLMTLIQTEFSTTI